MKMKHLKHLLIAAAITALCACNNTKESPVSLQWEMVKNEATPGFYESSFTITNTSDKPLESDWEIYYTQLAPLTVKTEKDSPVAIKMVNAGYYQITPSESWKALAPGDSIKINYLNQSALIQTLFAPKSPFFVTADNKQISIPFNIAPFDRQEQWTASSKITPPYPDGEKVYADNQALETTYKIQTYDMLPSLKEVTPREGTSIISKDISLSVEDGFADEAKLLIQNLKEMGYNVTDKGQTVIALCHFPKNMKAKNDEHYRLDVKDNYITISGRTPHAIFNGTQTLVSLLKKQTIPAKLENIAINDYPDLLYRGMMLDIARNFTKKADLLKLINQLAAYKINALHLHFSDDEAWRLEIPGLEELTAIGSRRGFTEDESQCLYPVYYGGWNPNDTTATANGYYTREDFIEILKYAAKRHISVIPEIESPGHARAAIKAMEARFNRLKEEDMEKAREYLLSEATDTSRYASAQAYTDNIMNVAMPSVYRFMDKVSDEIIKMYKDAGAPLATIHIGGDEVPRGSWTGSPICHQFMEEKNMKDTHELSEYFLENITEMLSKKGVKTSGWQEVALHHSPETNARIAPRFAGVYCWSTIGKQDVVPYTVANEGYDVILCNVNNLYIDLAYNPHKDEPGLTWGGYVNEFTSFNILPYNVYCSARENKAGEKNNLKTAGKGKIQLTEQSRPRIKGVQAQLFSETIGSFDMVQYYVFPKIFGLVERGWNAYPEWSPVPNDDKQALYEKARAIYNAKIAEIELPRLAADGFNFRVAQPGIKIVEGKLYANSPIPQAEIRYTTDGSEPTATSTLWEAPVDCSATVVKAKLFYLGKESHTTDYKND
jgi:hexosaminidase